MHFQKASVPGIGFQKKQFCRTNFLTKHVANLRAVLLEKSRKKMSGDFYHNNMFHSLAILLPVVTCHSTNMVPIKGKLESQTSKISMDALFGWWEG